jgi:hypothetical protein
MLEEVAKYLSNYEFVELIIRLIRGVFAPSSQTVGSLIEIPWPVKPARKMDLINSKFDEPLNYPGALAPWLIISMVIFVTLQENAVSWRFRCSLRECERDLKILT